MTVDCGLCIRFKREPVRSEANRIPYLRPLPSKASLFSRNYYTLNHLIPTIQFLPSLLATSPKKTSQPHSSFLTNTPASPSAIASVITSSDSPLQSRSNSTCLEHSIVINPSQTRAAGADSNSSHSVLGRRKDIISQLHIEAPTQ